MDMDGREPAAGKAPGEGKGAGASADCHWVLAFDSTHAAMAAQKLLGHLNPYVIPTPREITADCGMSLRLGMEVAEEAMGILEGHSEIRDLCHWHLL